MLDKILLELRGIGDLVIRIVSLADDPRPFLIKFDQGAGHILSFVRIAAEQCRPGTSAQHLDQLPAQIEGVAH